MVAVVRIMLLVMSATYATSSEIGSADAGSGQGDSIQVVEFIGSFDVQLLGSNFSDPPIELDGLNASVCTFQPLTAGPAVWLRLELTDASAYSISTCDKSSNLDTQLLVCDPTMEQAACCSTRLASCVG